MQNGKPTSKDDRGPGFYILEHVPTKREYGGSTSNTYVRLTNHFDRLRDGKHHNQALQEAYTADPENFAVRFERTETEEEAIVMEQQFFDSVGQEGRLFNRSLDARAPGKGVFPSDEVRKKISEAGMGRTHSEETKAKMRGSFLGVNTGRVRTEEHKSAVSERHLGVPLSEEHKAKLRVAARNRGNSVVCIDGQEFPTMTAAAQALGICRPTVAARINSQHYPNWFIRNLEGTENV